MSKIQRISVKNFKAIDELEVNFNGCTAIVTAGNNKGKTTFLRGIVDRIRGTKVPHVVKEGMTEGSGTIELTSGEQFVWDFDTKKEKLTFITKEGIKTKVTKEIVARFFPPSFDIDKFLNSPPQEQTKQLQKIIGVDFSEIDAQYLLAYNYRTEKNKEAERFQVKLAKMLEVPKVDVVDIAELIKQKEEIKNTLSDTYLQNKKKNETLRSDWEKKKAEIDENCLHFNLIQDKLKASFESCEAAAKILTVEGFHNADMNFFVSTLQVSILPKKDVLELYPVEPTYILELPDDYALKVIDDKLLAASETNAKAKQYQEYIEYKESVDEAVEAAKDADEAVKKIEATRQKMITSCKMPKGISFSASGEILVDGFILDKAQISTSKLYCCALRIAAMNLGEVHALHFDASFLDRDTLAEIEAWAKENDFQLLIERVDFDNGMIKYELLEK